MKWIFNDDKKIITIETPKGKKIEINEDDNSMILSDENQNKISLTSDGITIESVKNISIKTSGGDVKILGYAALVQLTTSSGIGRKPEGSRQQVGLMWIGPARFRRAAHILPRSPHTFE